MNNTYLPMDYLPIVVQFLLAVAFVGGTLVVTHLIGPSRKGQVKDDPFECGVESLGDARTPISVKYFLVAILFVLFDVEVIFMYPWAVNFREIGATGLSAMAIFLGILLFGLYYEFKKGVLKWED
ncbi:NADH-quinone oxidoreductase subunit A [Ravibacter arvi]|uniref:NADH-quinone oxidoreductase subunit A n=1 Tax=Ravibacter arvi TaxID=2051041 RepID=A0ABP8LX52_9BACT